MSTLQPEGVPFELFGRTWHLKWTLAAIDKVQERFDEPIGETIVRLTDERQLPLAVANILSILITDEIDRSGIDAAQPTVKDIMWAIDITSLGTATSALLKAYGISMPDDEEESPKN